MHLLLSSAVLQLLKKLVWGFKLYFFLSETSFFSYPYYRLVGIWQAFTPCQSSCISFPALAYKPEGSVVVLSNSSNLVSYSTGPSPSSYDFNTFSSLSENDTQDSSKLLIGSHTSKIQVVSVTKTKPKLRLCQISRQNSIFVWLQWSVLVLYMIYSTNKTCSLSFSWWWILGNKCFPQEPVLAWSKGIV